MSIIHVDNQAPHIGNTKMPKRSQNFSEEYSQHKRSQAQAIGARIAQRRKQLRLTQKDLRMRMKEENIPVSRSQFSRIENGEILPDYFVN
jgi:hypothetical protein